ncbi:MAG: dihydrofolate reductase [Mycoplasma sp.]
MLKMILCVDSKNGIGKDNALPWNIKAEMQHFKDTTSGHTVVMGRKTYDSIGRLLPNRENIIITNQDLKIEGATITNSIDDVLHLSKTKDVFIIGGQQIYDLFVEHCDELIISRLEETYDCDTFINFNFKFFELHKTINQNEFKVEHYKSIHPKILNGKKVSNVIKKNLKKELVTLVEKYKQTPKLTIVQVGDDFASSVYIKNKIKLGNEIGIEVDHVKYESTISQSELTANINKLNNDKSVNGILIQLPLPKTIDENEISQVINPIKDVDCFNPINVGHIWTNPKSNLVNTIPCTPGGIMELLKFYNINLTSKKVVIVGRSNIVGKPLVSLFLSEDSTVEICHSKTNDLKTICKGADILVAAIGKPNFINKEFVKDGAIVIDVGINRDEHNKLCGDVDYHDVIKHVEYISPVPMGVGPMTLAMLMKNILHCYKKQLS